MVGGTGDITGNTDVIQGDATLVYDVGRNDLDVSFTGVYNLNTRAGVPIEPRVGGSNLHRFRGDSSLKNPWKLVLSTSQDIQLSCKVAYMPSFNHRGIRLLPVRPNRYHSHLAIMSHKVIMLCRTVRVTWSANLQHGPDIANLDNRISHLVRQPARIRVVQGSCRLARRAPDP